MVCRAGKYEALSLAIRKNYFSLAKKVLEHPGVLFSDEKWEDYILLIKALQRGRRRIVKLLLEKGCRVNIEIKTNFFHTPLYYAVRLKDIPLVRLLLRKGALINGRDCNKYSPFWLALKKKNYKIVDILLSEYLHQVINVTNFNNDDCVAFNAACLRNKEHVVDNFIKQGFCVNKYLNSESEDESKCTPLHVAVKHQSIHVISLLLQHGADINAKNGIGQTPLHLAYYMTKLHYPYKVSWKIIAMLLSEVKKTKVNAVDKTGLSHFHIACRRNQIDIVEHLLECKADINNSVHFDSPTCSGYTPLHFAIENGNQKIVELLLSRGADTTIKNKTGDTPFHFAFSFFYFDHNLIDFILSKYVPKNINPVNCNGLSHFHIACATENINAIKAFLDNGALINAAVNFDSSKCPGYTPLHFAVSFNRKTAVETLLQNNADPNAKESEGLSSLHLACQQNAKKIHTILRNSVQFSQSHKKVDIPSAYKACPGKFLDSIANQTEQLEIVDLLLRYKSNVNCQDNLGKTPLFYACDIDHETFTCVFGKHITQPLYSVLNEFNKKRDKMIETLLEYKSNVNIYDYSGKTVLHYIADTDKVFGDDKKANVAAVLLREGADVNARTKTGLTPLHIALKRGFVDLAKVFLQYDVDPNVADFENLCTPLHLATYNDLLAPNSEEIISALLAKGADVNMKQIDGKTALHIAASTRYTTDRLIPLLEKDCEVDSQDKRGKTPLHMACLNRNAENVRNLLMKGADINITDRLGKTPLFYFYEFQKEVLDNRRLIYQFHPIYYIFKYHIRRLSTIGYYVSWENMTYYMELKDLHKQVPNNDENDILIRCEEDVLNMKHIKINSFATLFDILFKDPNEMALYIRNDKLCGILNSSNFKKNFPQYGFLLELQFKRGLKRSELLKPAKDSLALLIGFNLPDSCSERIFRYLNNKTLKDLIKTLTITG